MDDLKDLMDPEKPITPVQPIVDESKPFFPGQTTATGTAEAAPPAPISPPASETSQTYGTTARDLMSTPNLEQDRPGPITSQVNANETVSGQMNDLLSTGSRYLEQGKQEGIQYAASRGLQNSSLAGQAGEEGRIRAALPIAQQDATTYGRRAELNQNTQNEFAITQVNHLNRLIETAQQGDINSRLQLEQFGFDQSMSVQENLQQLERMAFAGNIEAQQQFRAFNYQTMLSDQQQGFAIELEDVRFQQNQQLIAQEFANALGLSSQESSQRISELNAQHSNTLQEIAARATAESGVIDQEMALRLQGSYLTQVSARMAQGSEEIQSIYQQEGLTAQQQQYAVAQAERRMQEDIALMGTYYSRSPQWDDDFNTNPNVPPPSVPGTPGTPIPGGDVMDDGSLPPPTDADARDELIDRLRDGLPTAVM